MIVRCAPLSVHLNQNCNKTVAKLRSARLLLEELNISDLTFFDLKKGTEIHVVMCEG